MRSLVGASRSSRSEMLEPEIVDKLHGFRRRMQWFIENRPRPPAPLSIMRGPGREAAPAPVHRRRAISSRASCSYLLDENEFLSPARDPLGLARPPEQPYVLHVDGDGAPRGLRARRVHHRPLRRQFELARAGVVSRQLSDRRVAPAVPPFLRRSPSRWNAPPARRTAADALWEVATELSRRLTRIFLRDEGGRRPVYGGAETLPDRPALARPRARSTSTSTATTARASGPATRRAGRAWWPSSSSRAAKPEELRAAGAQRLPEGGLAPIGRGEALEPVVVVGARKEHRHHLLARPFQSRSPQVIGVWPPPLDRKNAARPTLRMAAASGVASRWSFRHR